MSRSKFSVLRIEDDSDDEFSAPVVKKNGGQMGKEGQKKSQSQVPNGNTKLIIHAVNTQRPKQKKAIKDKVVDPTTGFVIQNAKSSCLEEDLKKERLRQAVAAEAVGETRVTEEEKKPVELMTEDDLITKFAVLFPGQAEKAVAEFYRGQLTEVQSELDSVKEELSKANARTEHYRNRYRKILDLLRDAEVSEKAKILVDLGKAETEIQDLKNKLSLARMRGK